MTYHQLTEPERYLISKLQKTSHRVAEIARIVERHLNTTYRDSMAVITGAVVQHTLVAALSL